MDCDGATTPGCETPVGDLVNCGSCGHACTPLANQNAACTAGACSLTCQTGFADCDKDPSTGCEVSLGDIANCKSCGDVCTPGLNQVASCTGKGCANTCSTGFADCDSTIAGCETPVTADLNNCGGCGTKCSPGPNQDATCENGACILTCKAGFKDCDGLASNGCEVPVLSDIANCGACGTKCAAEANEPASCLGGTCQNYLCDMGFMDCNHDTTGKLISILTCCSMLYECRVYGLLGGRPAHLSWELNTSVPKSTTCNSESYKLTR
jgi:hypothetical protein